MFSWLVLGGEKSSHVVFLSRAKKPRPGMTVRQAEGLANWLSPTARPGVSASMLTLSFHFCAALGLELEFTREMAYSCDKSLQGGMTGHEPEKRFRSGHARMPSPRHGRLCRAREKPP
jgi:hypothetical protein